MLNTHWIRACLLLIIVAVGLVAPSVTPRAESQALSVDFFCVSIGGGRLHCTATASGGTGSYTYTWSPSPFSGSGNSVLIRCIAFKNKNVQVTVMDSSGATASGSGTFFCGNAP